MKIHWDQVVLMNFHFYSIHNCNNAGQQDE